MVSTIDMLDEYGMDRGEKVVGMKFVIDLYFCNS